MDSEQKERLEQYEEEKRMLTQKLAEVLDRNMALHDRVAELDIAMNMETVELKREIETLASEKEALLRENELFLEDYATKDHAIYELQKELQIKHLMLEETSSFLSTATERIRFLEKKCAFPEKTENGPASAPVADGLRPAEIQDHEMELEAALEKKEHEIQNLSRDIEELREENKHLAIEKTETRAETSGAPESSLSLEDTLWEMEHSLKLLEQRFSNASEITGQEKEELFLRLDDAHREIFSLKEYHRSILEALRMTDEEAKDKIFSMSEYHASVLESLRKAEKENEALRAEMKDFLSGKELQDSALQERQEEERRKFLDEQAGLRAGIEKADRDIRLLTDEKAALEISLKKAGEQTARLTDMLSGRDAAFEEIRRSMSLREEKASVTAREINEKLQAAVAKAASVEEALAKGELHRAALEDALKRKEMVLEELHAHFIEDTEKLQAEAAKQGAEALRSREELNKLGAETAARTEELAALKRQLTSSAAVDMVTAKLREEAASAQQELRRLESEAADRAAEIKGLRDALAGYEAGRDQESMKIRELTDQAARLEKEQQFAAEASSREREALQRRMHEKEHELGIVSGLKAEAEMQLKEAGLKISGLSEELEGLKASQTAQGQYSRLAEENELLSMKLVEATNNAGALHELKTFVSAEIGRLAEQVRSLKEEDIEKQAGLKNNITETLTMMSESAGRLEQAIAGGVALARKLEEVSTAAKEHLPVVSGRPVYETQQEPGGRPGRRMAAALAVLIAALVLAGILFRADISGLLSRGKEPPAVAAVWAAGVKTARSGGYDISVTFLNNEAVSVLGYSGLIPDSILRDNSVALIVVRAESGCIPEDFVSSPENHISFINDQGGAVPLNAAGPFSEEKKTFFKKNACNGTPGAVYLKHLVSAPKLSGIKGLDIKGLLEEPIAIR
ncbi:MAG: coiled-coil domain-containing protein [Thermodesulfovibrionales bacterium]